LTRKHSCGITEFGKEASGSRLLCRYPHKPLVVGSNPSAAINQACKRRLEFQALSDSVTIHEVRGVVKWLSFGQGRTLYEREKDSLDLEKKLLS